MTMSLAGCYKLQGLVDLPQPGTSAGTVAGDQAVTKRVQAALLGNADLKNLDIAVAVRKGDARLTGRVARQAQIDEAVSRARGVEGVHSIHNELLIAH
jgi:hyperosmotically inducible periplasmic protein